MKVLQEKWIVEVEVNSILEMFSSLKSYIKYSNNIGNGDSKTFKTILDSNSYNDDPNVTKKKSIKYVQKRMRSHLRNAKKKNKTIRGRGAGKLIRDLIMYYKLAIRRNSQTNVETK